MKITQEENNLLLAELIRTISKPLLDKNHEVTVFMLIESTGRTDAVCRRILENKVAHEGWLSHPVIAERGKAVNAYYNPTQWKPEVK